MMDTTGLAFLGLSFGIVVLAMIGLGVGVILRKKTPLKGSCRGDACDHGGPDRHDGTCLCQQASSEIPRPD